MQHRFLCVILFALALAPKINESKKLCFDSNGSFKIAQFADHQITGNNVNDNGTAYWAQVVKPCMQTDTQWAIVFGNHDDLSVSSGTRKELLEFDTSYPLSLSQFGPDGIHGLTNYYLPLYSNCNSENPSWILYFFDSGGGTYPELVYDDQIDWFKNVSSEIKRAYGSIPSLTFLHIPSTEYENLYQQSLCFGMDDDDVSPQISPNQLLTVLTAFGNTKAVFVGHDHGNDWCCPFAGGLMVCYGRHTGYGGYGDWARGSRIIELFTDTLSVKTYVRMEDGSIIDGN
eukprot:Em0006g973a